MSSLQAYLGLTIDWPFPYLHVILDMFLLLLVFMSAWFGWVI